MAAGCQVLVSDKLQHCCFREREHTFIWPWNRLLMCICKIYLNVMEWQVEPGECRWTCQTPTSVASMAVSPTSRWTGRPFSWSPREKITNLSNSVMLKYSLTIPGLIFVETLLTRDTLRPPVTRYKLVHQSQGQGYRMTFPLTLLFLHRQHRLEVSYLLTCLMASLVY